MPVERTLLVGILPERLMQLVQGDAASGWPSRRDLRTYSFVVTDLAHLASVPTMEERDDPAVIVYLDDVKDAAHAIAAHAHAWLTASDLHERGWSKARLVAQAAADGLRTWKRATRAQLREEMTTSLEEYRESILERTVDLMRGPVQTLRDLADGVRGLEDAWQTIDMGKLLASEVFVPRSRDTDMQALVQAAVDGVAGLARARGIKLQSSLTPARAQVDPGIIADALDSLLLEALQGATRIHVTLEAQRDSIAIGIESDGLSENAGPTLDPRHYVAERAFHDHDGQVEWTREPTQTRIQITLPRKRSARGQRALQILQVEDNLDDRAVLASLLQRLDLPIQLLQAETIDEARNILAQGGIDLVFLDLDLPDSQPDETIEHASRWAPWIPVIVVTGDEREDTAQRIHRVGGRDYLPKRSLTKEGVLGSLLRSAFLNRTLLEALRLRP